MYYIWKLITDVGLSIKLDDQKEISVIQIIEINPFYDASDYNGLKKTVFLFFEICNSVHTPALNRFQLEVMRDAL